MFWNNKKNVICKSIAVFNKEEGSFVIMFMNKLPLYILSSIMESIISALMIGREKKKI